MHNISFSYSILTHNETESLENLLEFLLEYKDEQDEIVILDDYSDNKQTKQLLEVYSTVYNIKVEQRQLLEDFSGQKNHLREMCSKDYIFNIDSDEIPKKYLIQNIKDIIEVNPNIELFYVPRINIVEGITQEYINKMRWNINDNGWINFPDYQSRLSKNRPHIRWENSVHETLKGFLEYTHLPDDGRFCLLHNKTMGKQLKQNEFYDKIIETENMIKL